MPVYRWVPRPIRQVWRLTFEALVDAAGTDPDPAVRAAAVERAGAGWPEDPSTRALLRRAAEDPDGHVRLAAIRTLSRRPRETDSWPGRRGSWTRHGA